MDEQQAHGAHGSRRKRALGIALVAAMALVLAACQPVTFGNPGAKVGNDIDPANCPGAEAAQAPPCGPQPMLWASINGPYDNYANGDPYSTHCAPGGGLGPACTATNPDYRTTGYAYVIDVAPEDVGKVLDLQGYDIGTYPRSVGYGGANAPAARSISVTSTSGSKTLTAVGGIFNQSDVNQPVSGPWCGTSCGSLKIVSVANATSAVLSAAATVTGTWPASIGYDCNTATGPFNAARYLGLSGAGCQTGDDSDLGGQNFDVQLFDNDGTEAPSFANPLPGCHLSLSAETLTASAPTFKNAWTTVCSFTPTKKGPYAFRVRNSGIPGLADTGQGGNQYALKVLGGSATKLHAVNDQSVYVVPMASTATAYLIDVPAANAGKKIVVDLYDAGDGSGASPIAVQVKAPPGGAPSVVPAGTGVTVPAAGVATACDHNAIGSPTIGPATPDVADACAVTTYTGTGPSAYNGKWLRIEVTLDPAYTCSSDCWWTLHWDWGTAGLPTDRLTYTAKVV